MKKLLSSLIVPALFGAICLAGSSEAFAARTYNAIENQPCHVKKFKNLNRYKSDGWDRVFTDSQVAPVLKTLLKSDFKILKDSLPSADYPDSMSFVDESGVLTLKGGVPGLYTIMEAKFIVEPCGNIYVALLDNGDRILYYTNDRAAAGELPAALEEWRRELESRRGQSKDEKPAELAVVYKNK